NRRSVTFRRDLLAARTAEGAIGIVVNFAALDDGNLRVHEPDQIAENPRLRLAAQPEQNEVVARENGIDDLRDHRIVVPVHAREERLALFHLAEKIFAKLL